MSDLQKAIRRELHNFNTFTTYYVSSEEQFESGVNTCAKNIEKAVRKALLAPEALDAYLERSYGWVDYDKGLTYQDLPETDKEECREEARHELLGALDAALGGDGHE